MFDLFLGQTQATGADDAPTVLGDLRAAVKLWLGSAAPRHVFLHAGIVGWHGRAIVFPGRRGMGKTSLVQAFLRRGATYLSDDMAVIDSHGLVLPYPLPLSVRDVDADLSVSRTPQGDVPAGALGAHTEASLAYLVERATPSAGLASGRKPKDAGPHVLRHTCCSHLAMRGAPAPAMQRLAGHRDLMTTQRYVHLTPAAIEGAIRLLELLLPAGLRGNSGAVDQAAGARC